MSARSAAVVVVGLGPVGATAALLLARQGIETLVLERRRQIESSTRAVTTDDEALRVLADAGVGRELPAPPMLTEEPIRFRSRTGGLLLELPPRLTVYGHPSVAFLHQAELESGLCEGLEHSGAVAVRRGTEVVGARQDADGVTLALQATPSGRALELRAGYVLACDGARSAVRTALGIPLRGFTSRRRWLAVDAADGGTRSGEGGFEFLCDPCRPAANGPLPGGRHRFEFMLRPDEDSDEATVARLLAPWGTVEPIRAGAYPQHARVAPRWRRGRVFLLGDAAHLSPTFAGQGLSAGLRDAGNLCWKLAAVLKGRGAPALLDSYEAERRPHALRMLALAVALGRAVESQRREVAALRDGALRLGLRSAPVRRWTAEAAWKPRPRVRRGLVAPRTSRGARGAMRREKSSGAAGLVGWNEARPSRGLVEPAGPTGTLAPQPLVACQSGAAVALDELLGPGFALVGLGIDPEVRLGHGERALLDQLAARRVTVHAEALGPGWREGRVALVRPDRYVFGIWDAGDAGAGVRDLAAALRAPPARR